MVNYDGRVDFFQEDDKDDQGQDSQSMDVGTSWSAEKNGDRHPTSSTQHQKPPSPPETRTVDLKTGQNGSNDAFEVKNSFSSSQQGTTGSGTALDWDVSKDSIDPSDSTVKASVARIR